MATQSMFDRLYVTYYYIENGETKKVENQKFSELTDEEKKSITALCFLPVYNKDGSLSSGKHDISEYITGFPILSAIYYPAQFDKISLSKIKAQSPMLEKVFRTASTDQENIRDFDVSGLRKLKVKSDSKIAENLESGAYGLLSGDQTVIEEIAVEPRSISATKSSTRPQYAKSSDVEKAMAELAQKLQAIEDAVKSKGDISPEQLEKMLKRFPTKTQLQNRLNGLVGKITEEELSQIKEAILNINITIDSTQLISSVNSSFNSAIEKIGAKYEAQENKDLKKILEALDKIAVSDLDEKTKQEEIYNIFKQKIPGMIETINTLVFKYGAMLGEKNGENLGAKIDRVEGKVDGIDQKVDNIEAGNELIIEAIGQFADKFPEYLKTMDFSEDSKKFIQETFQTYINEFAAKIQSGHSEELKEINEKLSKMVTKDDIQKIIYESLVSRDATTYNQNVQLLTIVSNFITNTIIEKMDGIKGLSEIDLTNIENRFMSIFNNTEFSTLLTQILNDSEFAKKEDINDLVDYMGKLHAEELEKIEQELGKKFEGFAKLEDIEAQFAKMIGKDEKGEFFGLIPEYISKKFANSLAEVGKGMTKEELIALLKSPQGMDLVREAIGIAGLEGSAARQEAEIKSMKETLEKILGRMSAEDKKDEEGKDDKKDEIPQRDIPHVDDKKLDELLGIVKDIRDNMGKATNPEAIKNIIQIYMDSYNASHGMARGLYYGTDYDPRYADLMRLRYAPIGVPYNVDIQNIIAQVISIMGYPYPPKPIPDDRDKLIEEYKKQIALVQEQNKKLEEQNKKLAEENEKLRKDVEDLKKQLAEHKAKDKDSEKDDDKDKDKEDKNKKKQTTPTPKPQPKPKPEPKTKFVVESRKALEKLAEPKLPWYKRLGNKIKKNPFLFTLCGLGVGALVAGAATVIGVGGIGAAIGLIKNASMWFQPTLALLKNVGIGAAAGLGASGLATIGLKIFGKGSKRDRLYNKFRRQYDKCHDYQDKMERHNQKVSQAEQNLADSQEQLAGALKHKSRYVRKVAKSKRKLGILRAKQMRQNSEYKAKVQDAVKTKTRLNDMEDDAGKTLAQNGELQKYRKITAKYQAKIQQIEASNMDPDTKEQLIDDIKTRLEVKRARHTINADGEDISILSGTYKTYDKETADLIASVKGKKTKLMEKSNNDIFDRNSGPREVSIEEVPVVTSEDVKEYNEAIASNTEEGKKTAEAIRQRIEDVSKKRKQFFEECRGPEKRMISTLEDASQSTLDYLLKQGKISQAEYDEIMNSRYNGGKEEETESKTQTMPQPTAQKAQGNPQASVQQSADAESQR